MVSKIAVAIAAAIIVGLPLAASAAPKHRATHGQRSTAVRAGKPSRPSAPANPSGIGPSYQYGAPPVRPPCWPCV